MWSPKVGSLDGEGGDSGPDPNIHDDCRPVPHPTLPTRIVVKRKMGRKGDLELFQEERIEKFPVLTDGN